MRAGVVAVALAGGLILAAGLGAGEAIVDGQVLFVPTTEPILAGVTVAGPLQIRACDPSVDGLRVTGTVAAVAAVITVMVSADDPTVPGVRVGRGFATQAGLLDDSVVGDFSVTLPWADETAMFAVREADSTTRAASGVGCPARGLPAS